MRRNLTFYSHRHNPNTEHGQSTTSPHHSLAPTNGSVPSTKPSVPGGLVYAVTALWPFELASFPQDDIVLSVFVSFHCCIVLHHTSCGSCALTTYAVLGIMMELGFVWLSVVFFCLHLPRTQVAVAVEQWTWPSGCRQTACWSGCAMCTPSSI